MRLFVALDINEEIKMKVNNIISSLKTFPSVKWVEKENLHITLKFLGEVREELVNEIMKRIESLAKETKPFSFTLQGLGYFGSAKFPKVIWIGVKDGKNEIISLMNDMNILLDDVNKDSYPPRAHLTIGRVKMNVKTEDMIRKIQEMNDVKTSEQKVNIISLKQSIMRKNGPQYSDVKIFNLGQGDKV